MLSLSFCIHLFVLYFSHSAMFSLLMETAEPWFSSFEREVRKVPGMILSKTLHWYFVSVKFKVQSCYRYTCLNISGQRRDVNQHPLCKTTGLGPFCGHSDQSQPYSGPASKETRHWTVHAPQQTRNSSPDLWHVSMNESYLKMFLIKCNIIVYLKTII